MSPVPAMPSDHLIFAPVGITHLTRDNADLVRAAAAGRSRVRVTTTAQLNGVPHFGTVVTMLTVFAFAQHTTESLGLPASIVFDALENAPAEHLTIDGDIYTRSVGDLIDTGHLDRAERTGGFEQLLAWAQRRSGISYEFRPYDAYQGLRTWGTFCARFTSPTSSPSRSRRNSVRTRSHGKPPVPVSAPPGEGTSANSRQRLCPSGMPGLVRGESRGHRVAVQDEKLYGRMPGWTTTAHAACSSPSATRCRGC